MAIFQVQNITETSCRIAVVQIPGKVPIRFYIRTDPSDGHDIDVTYTATQTTMLQYFTLIPGTSYIANVSVDGTWLGAQSF